MRVRRREHRRAPWFLAGAGAGALTLFFMDPSLGRRRRVIARDRTAGVVRRGTRRTARRGSVAGAYGVGWTRRLLHWREQPKEYDDATLAQKVQTEVFRDADAPKGTVDVSVANGVVQLRGEVQRPELIEELVEKVRAVQGVREVESFLHLPKTPAPSEP